MGSLLNFVFLSDTLVTNGEGSYAGAGPFFNYLTENNLQYSLGGQLKTGFKNILPIEINKGGWAVREIPNEVFKFVNDNDVKLLIMNLPDPTSKDTYEFSLNHLKENGIDFNKIIYIDTNLRLLDVKTNLSHKLYAFNFFIEEATWQKRYFHDNETSLHHISKTIEPSKLDNFRNRKFLCFNRSLNRAHRFVLLDEFMKGTFDNSYFSFIRPIDYFSENEQFFIEYTGTKPHPVELYNQKLPIELDTHQIKQKDSFNTVNVFKKDLFLDSCIHIVTETTFVNNELFLSEKVLKPLLSYQPFIVFGPYGYLKELKKYGFKTFSEFWDESYDEIENSVERMKTLISLVKTLNNKSVEELNDIYRSTKDICIYNRNLFYSLELDTLKVIFEEIENEW